MNPHFFTAPFCFAFVSSQNRSTDPHTKRNPEACLLGSFFVHLQWQGKVGKNTGKILSA